MDLYKISKRYIPSGVNSPVRAFGAVGGRPVFIRKGRGPWVWDENGKRYLDFCASWGPLLFGHAPEGLVRTVQKVVRRGTSFGAATYPEAHLARRIHEFFPSMEKVRLVSSGTEAVMSAIRLARGVTGRKKILKLDGGYHGHADSLLVQAGSGIATFGIPGSAGVPEELARLTLTIPFNDEAALELIFKKEGNNIAAFILEPVPANMGVVLPVDGYLERARQLTREYNTLLILDEVITGLRLGAGGAQGRFGVRADLTCLGKILGGGFPLAAFGGRGDIMDHLAPGGSVYQAGTLSGNPVAVAASLWMLGEIRREGSRNGKTVPKVYERLEKRSRYFFSKLRELIDRDGLPVQLNAVASMFTLFFSADPVVDYASAKKSDTEKFKRFFQSCLAYGVYLSPSQFEANFISDAHGERELEKALKLFRDLLPAACR